MGPWQEGPVAGSTCSMAVLKQDKKPSGRDPRRLPIRASNRRITTGNRSSAEEEDPTAVPIVTVAQAWNVRGVAVRAGRDVFVRNEMEV